MWLLLLEAGLAFFLLAFIVWWTMFSGRKPEPKITPKVRADQTLPPRDEPSA